MRVKGLSRAMSMRCRILVFFSILQCGSRMVRVGPPKDRQKNSRIDLRDGDPTASIVYVKSGSFPCVQ